MFTGLKLYGLIAAGIAAAALFVYVQYLRHSVDHWKEENAKTVAVLMSERESHKLAEEQAEIKRTADLAEANRIQYEATIHLQERIHANADAAADLRERLRVAERGRLSPAKAASSAPAQCGDYAADPTRLSQQDREFLIGLAIEADATADLIEACRADYKAVRVACGAP